MQIHKILLVDDVDFFLELETGFLKETPAHILTACNGRDALEIARREKPSLIYLDMQMPIMDGLTCLKEIRRDPELSEIPVIILYAPTRDISDDDFLKEGAECVLHKPVDRKAFLDAGRNFLFAVERREKRGSCQALARLYWMGLEFHTTTEDISCGGAYIRSKDHLEPEDRLTLSLLLPGATETVFECKARVAWVNQGFPRTILRLPQGFGVQFLDLTPEQTLFLRNHISEITQSMKKDSE